jgi:microcystin-dependent protein
MATNYPGALDNGTNMPNPGSGSFTNSPSHATQHDNANDAIKALEAKVGIGASTPGGSNQVLISTSSGTTSWGANAPAWGAITGTLSNQTDLQTALNAKLSLAGGTMTGAITLAADPAAALQAATKQYVDAVGVPTGAMQPYAGRAAPTGFVMCDGVARSRATYAALFAIISPTLGTFTITIAAPAVVTLNGHGFITGDQVYFTTTGALPTGLAINTIYFVVRIDANTFNLSTTLANAIAATKITTTGTQSGTHTAVACPYGLGDGTTTFNVPDLRGRVPAGADAMAGAAAASRLTLAQTGGSYGVLGAFGGEQGHIITTAELASHTHGQSTTRGGINWAGGASTGQDSSLGNGLATASTGSDNAHNTVQPTVVTNYIIKT